MTTNYLSYHPEIWGGIECTINRIEGTFRDQLNYAGHYNRDDDIDVIARLGIKKLRYPILWEAHQSFSADEKINWKRTRAQLEKLRSHHIIPIAGLVHHGSGPSFTGLLNNKFPEQLATYAAKVAKEFPWLEYYTPVNEPLTTARFSGLYGYWFPHHKSPLSFVIMLLNQLKGIVLSMKAIRKINPEAKLVQTEDLAKTHSSATLKYQADFENERRWLTYDILCGKLDKHHILWQYITSLGIDENLLNFFLDNPCFPDIAGQNYYVTSERYLDEKIDFYPADSHGGNGQHVYADIAAVRAIKPEGCKTLLQEAWNRYKLPLALTEVHMNCTREEQLRWFKEAWDNCCKLKKEGVDVKAITAWSLLGAFDWNSLLIREDKNYESGVYDIRNNELRPTALAKLIYSLSTTRAYSHPLIEEPGWWHKSYPNAKNIKYSLTSPLLIVGKNGTLATALQKICRQRSIPFYAFGRKYLDITDKNQLEALIEKYRPWAIINAAGYVNVDDAETHTDECFRVNSTGPFLIAECCRKKQIRFMTFSSDLVFNGKKNTPYLETDELAPLNVYGKSKAKAESLIINSDPSTLIIRTSAFFGPWDSYNFPMQTINSLKEDRLCNVADDVIVSPTYIPDLVNNALDLFIDEEEGIWHLTNEGKITWYDFAFEIAERAGLRTNNLSKCSKDDMNWKAPRPGFSALQSSKGINLPSLDNAIQRFFEEKIVS